MSSQTSPRFRPRLAGRQGLIADCLDDQGTEFAVWQIEDRFERPPPIGRRPGDLSYLTLQVVDSATARAFYGAVLHWTFTPGRVADGRQVSDVVPLTGLSGGHAQPAAVPMWRVADIECTDDQGSRFYLDRL